MKILLLGKNGQVGWELQRSLSLLGELVALGRDEGDLTDLPGLVAMIQQLKPHVIVNAAAYTAVDKAETDFELAHLVNAKAIGVLAEEAVQLDALLVHYSTDYVFDGSGEQFWLESDQANPLSVYGVSKLMGEQLIQRAGCKHLILRTSWVYAARGSNFIKTILRLAQEKQTLQIVNDQVGAPTGAELLADVTAYCVQDMQRYPERSGVYHCVPNGLTTWYEYACFVIEQARQLGIPLQVQTVLPIATSQYPLPAARPLNSRLATKKLEETFGVVLPEWSNGVMRALHEMTGA